MTTFKELQFDLASMPKLGVQAMPCNRLSFPTPPDLRGVPAAVLITGIMVAIQETGHDGYIVRGDRLRVIEAASVKVTFTEAA